MSQTTTKASSPRPSAADAEQLCHVGKIAAAYEAVRAGELSSLFPQRDDFSRQILLEAARYFADHDKYADFNRVLQDAERFDSTNPDWLRTLAGLHLYAGNRDRAYELLRTPPDSEIAHDLERFAVDRCVRLKKPETVSHELRAGYQAIHDAYDRYTRADDEGCRAALETIGLRSPYLDWKLLLRGLIAYSNGEDARAAENWSRLDPKRLPARLAAPLRAVVDPTYRIASADRLALLDARARSLSPAFANEPLSRLRSQIGRDRDLAPAFRQAETVVKQWKAQAPALVNRLANCFYYAILDHGQPADLNRYRKLFGPPAEDPEFARLEAQVFEVMGDRELANQRWASYEVWLAKNPLGWPVDLVQRMCAKILYRMADNISEINDRDGHDLDMLESLISAGRQKKKKKLQDPTDLLLRAAELAPGWEELHQSLFMALLAEGNLEKAETTARNFLNHQPNSLPLLVVFAALLNRTHRAVESLAVQKHAFATNPLDPSLRVMLELAYVAAARQLMIDGDLAAAESTATTGKEFANPKLHGLYLAQLSVLARKAKRTADADSFQEAALAAPTGPLAAALVLTIDSTLAKLKPAEKKNAEQILGPLLAGQNLTPTHLLTAIAVLDQCREQGIEYRGQKTHEKKLLALAHTIALAPGAGAWEEEFEKLIELLATKGHWKDVAKLGASLSTLYRGNPLFPLMIAEAEFEKNGYPQYHRVMPQLTRAKELAEKSPHVRHRELLERIGELINQSAPGNFFSFIFDR